MPVFQDRFALPVVGINRRALIEAALAAFALPAARPSIAQTNLPVAAVRPVTDVYHGVAISDPYRYFENTKAPEVAAWMKAHSDHAWATLKKIQGRSALLAAIEKYDSAVTARNFGFVRTTGGAVFYQSRGAQDNQFKLVMRASMTAPEQVLVDPQALEKQTGKPHAINYFSVSPTGEHVAYGISQGGSEEAVLHVMEVASRKQVGKPIDRVQFGGIGWSQDGKTLFYNRLQALKKGTPQIEKFQRSQVWMLRTGAAESTAKRVFGFGTPGVKMTPVEIPFVALTVDGIWALGLVINGVQREQVVYAAKQADLLAGKARWRRVIDYSDEVTGFAYQGNAIYARTHKDAPRSKIVRIDLSAPKAAPALVMPQSERVVTGLAAASDALYIEARDGNIKRLYKRAWGAGAATVEVKLPLEGAFALADYSAEACDPRLPGALLDLQSWTRARQIYEVKADGSVVNTGLQPQGLFDAPADLVATEVKVKSHDGALVPMSIIHKRDVKLDGSNPTLLYGYASYGITEEPFFSVGRLAWMDAGGVFAVANPRGTSVYGQDWYKAGFQTTKPNSWKDFIACAEYLIAQKFTSPAKLGIMGGSAGGILVGRAMTERPDLFAAVISAVGSLDGLRFESTPNGVPNIPEFGSVKTKAGFEALRAMSTYANIQDGVRYPAVLLTHGVNDPRVEVWQTTKTAARLMAATANVPNARPVLMRLDYDSGHGIGDTKKQQFEERADVYAFLLWQMGVKGFEISS